MAYRNGTYIAFHANGKIEPTESDIKYYNLLKAWKVKTEGDFTFIDSHDKTGAIRDKSKHVTVEASLKERLKNSKNMLLIIGKTTKEDTDWVPLEISYAVDNCGIPIIAAYPGYLKIDAPHLLSGLWPDALSFRIRNGAAHVIHIPFTQEPIAAAISTFDLNKFPNGGGLGVYSDDAYRQWGIIK